MQSEVCGPVTMVMALSANKISSNWIFEKLAEQSTRKSLKKFRDQRSVYSFK